MKIHPVFILLLSIIISTVSIQSAQKCSYDHDIQQDQIVQTNQIQACFIVAIKNDWQNMLTHIISKNQQSHQNFFIKLLQKQIQRLQILQEQIVLGTSVTQPVLKWGQNKTHIFITLKLSHRWDSPPCLYTQSQNKQLQVKSVYYENVCLVSHQKIHFKLNLTLYKQVQTNDAAIQNFDVKKDGVGTYSVILTKKQPQIWVFLTEQQKIYPNWHQIATRYESDFKQFEKHVQTFKLVQKTQRQTKNSSQQSQL